MARADFDELRGHFFGPAKPDTKPGIYVLSDKNEGTQVEPEAGVQPGQFRAVFADGRSCTRRF